MIKSPHLYRAGAPADTSSAVIDRVLEIEQRQRHLGVHSVYTLGHLSFLTGIGSDYLRKVVSRQVDPYTVFDVSKRNGGKRSIAAPEADLQSVQRWIGVNIFAKMQNHGSSFAYQTGKSAPEAARRHAGANFLVKLDLKDFFHEIDERRIYRLLRKYRYDKLPAFEIARLCTRLPGKPQSWLPERYSRPSQSFRYDFAPYAAYPEHIGYLGYLPQGAPSSGAVANGIAHGLDTLLFEISAQKGFIYTRYADDLTFSSSRDFNRTEAESLIHSVRREVVGQGFRLNEAKSRISPPGSRLMVLGVLVDGERIRLSRRMRRSIEWHLRGIELNGMAAHSVHAKFRDVEGFVNYLFGLIYYANDVDPAYAAEKKALLNELLPAGWPKR